MLLPLFDDTVSEAEMKQRNLRRAIQTTVLCLCLVYVSFLVVWTATPPNNETSNSTNQSDQSSSLHSGSDRTPNLVNKYRNRQLKHVSNEVVLRTALFEASGQTENVNSNVPSIALINDLKQISPKVNLSLNDIFISVKTTRIFHQSRLEVILNTWFRLAKNQTYFFTDANDEKYNLKSGGHLINTNCSASHNRKALCCKMSVEFDSFIASNKKWFCHFDDDNYVNIPRLVQLLRLYDPLDDWYLGKPSIKQPLEIQDRDSKKKVNFWFATGGAGFCISKPLALKMIPIASDGRMISVGEKIRLPDDVTIGYIIEHILSKKLTVIDQFHSHLESMAMLPNASFANQVSFSYSGNGSNRNVLSLKKTNTKRSDPTRFYSLHCQLFPNLCKF